MPAIDKGFSAAGVGPLQRGRLTLDLAQRVLRYRGRVIRLSCQQSDVLRLLIEADGRVVSLAKLIEATGGDAVTAVSEARLRAVVRRLRGKLRDRELIETIGGEGYRLIE